MGRDVDASTLPAGAYDVDEATAETARRYLARRAVARGLTADLRMVLEHLGLADGGPVMFPCGHERVGNTVRAARGSGVGECRLCRNTRQRASYRHSKRRAGAA